MKKLIVLLIAISCCLCGCQNTGNGDSQNATKEKTETGGAVLDLPDRLTTEEEKAVIFANGYPQGFWARNDRGNGGMFNCSFIRDNAKVENGYLSLILDKDENGLLILNISDPKLFWSTSPYLVIQVE